MLIWMSPFLVQFIRVSRIDWSQGFVYLGYVFFLQNTVYIIFIIIEFTSDTLVDIVYIGYEMNGQ